MNSSVFSVINETDKVVAQKRLSNGLAKILVFLEPHRDERCGVVVESTFNWYWLVDGLQQAGHAVHLVNTVPIPARMSMGSAAVCILWPLTRARSPRFAPAHGCT